MIIFYGEGRLGNQILQYQALNRIAKHGEMVCAIGFEELHNTFELNGAKVIVLTHSLFIKRVYKYLLIPLILKPLAKWLRIFNYIHEPIDGSPPHTGSSGQLKLSEGLFSNLTFAHGGYYQNPALWESIFPNQSLTIKSALLAQVKQYLTEQVPVKATPVFVHVRRGDYVGYSTYGLNDLVLPSSFYRKAVREVREKIIDPWFVFVTDDAKWVTENFSDISDKSVASLNARFDFALMTQCHGGILSNSTYSLCAALLMNKPRVLLAPEYWFGFRVKKWLPPRIRIDHECVRYLDIGDLAA